MVKEKLCWTCAKGNHETIVGNGITEPPYLAMVRCPDDENYKWPDDSCEKWEGRE